MAPVPLREFGGRAPSLRGSQEASSALIEGSRAAPHRPHRFLDGGFQLKQGKKLKNRKKKNRCQGSSRKGTTGGCDGTWYGLTTGGAHTPEARADTTQTHPCFRTKKKKKIPFLTQTQPRELAPQRPGAAPLSPRGTGRAGPLRPPSPIRPACAGAAARAAPLRAGLRGSSSSRAARCGPARPSASPPVPSAPLPPSARPGPQARSNRPLPAFLRRRHGPERHHEHRRGLRGPGGGGGPLCAPSGRGRARRWRPGWALSPLGS